MSRSSFTELKVYGYIYIDIDIVSLQGFVSGTGAALVKPNARCCSATARTPRMHKAPKSRGVLGVLWGKGIDVAKINQKLPNLSF
jgi:hypothetical protein